MSLDTCKPYVDLQTCRRPLEHESVLPREEAAHLLKFASQKALKACGCHGNRGRSSPSSIFIDSGAGKLCIRQKYFDQD
jgi:hypothetical protein